MGIRGGHTGPPRGSWGQRWVAGGAGGRAMAPGGSAHPRLPTGADASRYAQIDITATEAARRAGAQHAQERLLGLQQRRRVPRSEAPRPDI